VRGELSISHKRGDMLGLLASLYGPNDPAALKASALARKAPASAKSIAYAARHVGLIVMASHAGRSFTLYVESSGGQLREGSVKVWSAIRDNGQKLKPKLERIVILDEDAKDVLATARAGVGGALSREDLFVPVATGLVTGIVLAAAEIFGGTSRDFLYGSATALAVAILSVGRLVWTSASKKLVWR